MLRVTRAGAVSEQMARRKTRRYRSTPGMLDGNVDSQKEKKNIKEGNGNSSPEHRPDQNRAQQIAAKRNEIVCICVVAAVFHRVPVGG